MGKKAGHRGPGLPIYCRDLPYRPAGKKRCQMSRNRNEQLANILNLFAAVFFLFAALVPYLFPD